MLTRPSAGDEQDVRGQVQEPGEGDLRLGRTQCPTSLPGSGLAEEPVLGSESRPRWLLSRSPSARPGHLRLSIKHWAATCSRG